MIRVLIVEDDPMVAQINRRYVESIEGFKVEGIFNNGDEALKYLEAHRVDLMILDIYMPRLDGMSLLEEMRKNQIMTDVILVTAAKDAGTIDNALKLGAVDYLIKPFEYDRLKKSLQNYQVRYRMLNNADVFNQEDIDKITSKAVTSPQHNNIQKGLHRRTLNRIREYMDNNSSRFVTAEDVADETGLSRVTVRRYLDHLASTGYVIAEVEYGSVGRPSYIYCVNKK
jgi:two-component system CitB family response regulator/two-component system response regulator DctR